MKTTIDKPKTSSFFFYGSLQSGYWNNPIISGLSHMVGRGLTIKLFDLWLGQRTPVPCVVPNDKGKPLHGEIWDLTEQDAMMVDNLEKGYSKGSFEVLSDSGVLYEASIYHAKEVGHCSYIYPNPSKVLSGDYRDMVNPDRTRVPDRI